MPNKVPSLKRRRVLGSVAGVATLALAGCLDGEADDDEEEEDDDEEEEEDDDGEEVDDDIFDDDDDDDDDMGTMTLFLENEDGEPANEGVSVMIELPGSPSMNVDLDGNVDFDDEGSVSTLTHERSGEFVFTATYDGEDYTETYEADAGEDFEVTIVIDGHPGPAEDDE